MPAPVSPSSPMITYGNIQDAVADSIRDMILKGHLKPGDRLCQDELAKTFGVSTMPIGEALRQLQAEDLVVFRPRRGAAVASLSVSECEEIYLIREALEALACRWAAEDFSRAPIDRLRLLLQEIEAVEANQMMPIGACNWCANSYSPSSRRAKKGTSCVSSQTCGVFPSNTVSTSIRSLSLGRTDSRITTVSIRPAAIEIQKHSLAHSASYGASATPCLSRSCAKKKAKDKQRKRLS